MKIVLVSKEYPPSRSSYGIGTYTGETARYLARTGHAVTVICASDDSFIGSDSREDDVRVIRLPDDEGPLQRSMLRRFLPSSGIVMSRYRTRVADCIDQLIDAGLAEIVEFPGFRGEAQIWAKRVRRIPMVSRMHGFTAWVDKFWKDRVVSSRRVQARAETEEFAAADHVTSVSEALRVRLLSRLPPQKVSTLHNGIDTAKWTEWSSKATDFVTKEDVVFVGSLTKLKGIHILIQAAEIMRKTYSWQGRLLLFGRSSRSFEAMMYGKYKQLDGDSSWMRVMGHYRREELGSIYAAAGVCCFPSLIEPFNYTALEAMASGGVVVGSLETGMAEMIEDGESGYLVPSGQPTNLAVKLRAVLSLDGSARDRLCVGAKKRVRESFDISVTVSKMIVLFESLIQQHRNKGIGQL